MSRYLLGGLIGLDLNFICCEIWPIQRAASIFIALVCLYVSVCARELKWAHLCASSRYFTVWVAISTQSYITTLAVGGCWFIAVKLSIKMALRFTHLLGHTWIAFLSFSLFLLHHFAFLSHTQTQTLKCTHTHAFCSNSCVQSCMSFAWAIACQCSLNCSGGPVLMHAWCPVCISVYVCCPFCSCLSYWLEQAKVSEACKTVSHSHLKLNQLSIQF